MTCPLLTVTKLPPSWTMSTLRPAEARRLQTCDTALVSSGHIEIYSFFWGYSKTFTGLELDMLKLIFNFKLTVLESYLQDSLLRN